MGHILHAHGRTTTDGRRELQNKSKKLNSSGLRCGVSPTTIQWRSGILSTTRSWGQKLSILTASIRLKKQSLGWSRSCLQAIACTFCRTHAASDSFFNSLGVADQFAQVLSGQPQATARFGAEILHRRLPALPEGHKAQPPRPRKGDNDGNQNFITNSHVIPATYE